MKSRTMVRFLWIVIVVSLVSLSVSSPRPHPGLRHRRRAGHQTDRLKRQLSQSVPMDWVEEQPYSEEEGVGNAVDMTDDETPNLPSAPEVPVRAHRPNGNKQRAPDNPFQSEEDYPMESGQDYPKQSEEDSPIRARSNDDYMNDFMKDMGIPKEGEKPAEGLNGQGDPSQDPIDLSKLVEICDQPVVIAAANRYANTTIRLFRGKDYWDLMGLPDRQAFVSKKKKLSPPLGPVDMKTSIVTILSGPHKDVTYKFSRNLFWAWNDSTGQQVSGGRGGENWMDLPQHVSDGFDTMFHNGNDSNPMIIAFKGSKVWYIGTDKPDFYFAGDEKGYDDGGRFGEKWPLGVTAALTYPLADRVSIYLFKEDKHCVRTVAPLKSGKDCDEWRENSELFGCSKNFEADQESTQKPKNQAPDISQTETTVADKSVPGKEPEPEAGNENPADTKNGATRGLISAGLAAFTAISPLLFTNILN